jgi:serine/threonine protein kinase
MKIIPKDKYEKYSKLMDLRNQMQKILHLDHPHVVPIKNFQEDKKNFYIISEYIPNGNLQQFITNSNEAINEVVVFMFACQISLALEFLHNEKINHGNLSLTNILLDNVPNVKITDYGTTIWTPTKLGILPASQLDTVAPEILVGGEATFNSDVWSLGAVLYFMCYKKNPYKGVSLKAKLDSMVRGNMIPMDGDKYSNNLRSLIKFCLIANDSHRPGWDDIFHCLWFKTMAQSLNINLHDYRNNRTSQQGSFFTMNDTPEESYTTQTQGNE